MTAICRVKICCIQSVKEAHLAIEYGAAALGLVSAMPSGPGVISEDTIAEIVKRVAPPVSTFLLTSATEAENIIRQHRKVNTDVLQLVDRVPSDTYKMLRQALPGVKLVQVVHVKDRTSVEEARAVEAYVDALLLDSGNPNADTKELGGTGRIHDWQISRKINEAVRTPVFLAGGLKPENVKDAIDKVQPFAVDICSGVRTNGRLDAFKLNKFMSAVHYSAKF